MADDGLQRAQSERTRHVIYHARERPRFVRIYATVSYEQLVWTPITHVCRQRSSIATSRCRYRPDSERSEAVDELVPADLVDVD